MFSYKEFPEQVKSEVKKFASENNFRLFEIHEDHCLRYRNETWELFFYCDHGLVELSLVNLEDGYRYLLDDIINIWFPESKFAKTSANHIWGSLETVKFKVNSLAYHFTEIIKVYAQEKDKLCTIRNRSWILIDFINKQGSKKLKSVFTISNDNWIELASYEYSKYKREQRR